jgi:hypothetical protein
MVKLENLERDNYYYLSRKSDNGTVIAYFDTDGEWSFCDPLEYHSSRDVHRHYVVKRKVDAYDEFSTNTEICEIIKKIERVQGYNIRMPDIVSVMALMSWTSVLGNDFDWWSIIRAIFLTIVAMVYQFNISKASKVPK